MLFGGGEMVLFIRIGNGFGLRPQRLFINRRQPAIVKKQICNGNGKQWEISFNNTGNCKKELAATRQQKMVIKTS